MDLSTCPFCGGSQCNWNSNVILCPSFAGFGSSFINDDVAFGFDAYPLQDEVRSPPLVGGYPDSLGITIVGYATREAKP